MNAVFELAITREPRRRLALSRDALATLDARFRPHALSRDIFMARLQFMVNDMAEPPWAVILWPRDYPLSGELAELRYTKRNLTLTSYAAMRELRIVWKTTILTSMLFVRRKAILEDMTCRSLLLNNAWALLEDCSPRRSWICVCDGPERDYAEAELLADADRYRAAMARAPDVRPTLREWMEKPAMQFERAVLQAADGLARYDLAARILERFCGLAPDEPVLWKDLGYARHLMGENDAARAAFSRALELAPNWLEARWGLVLARWAGRLTEATTELDALLETDPFDERFLEPRLAGYTRGVAPASRVHAEALLRRYVALRPDSSRALGELGTLLCQMGGFDEAIPFLRRSVILNPKVAYVWNNLAFAQATLGLNLAAAEYACRRSLALNQASSNTWDTLGVIAMKRKRFSEARTAFETALRLKPDAADSRANLEETNRQLNACHQGRHAAP